MPQTALGFRYGTLDDQPNGPAQDLTGFTDVDTYLQGNYCPVAYIRLGRSDPYTLIDDGQQHPVASWNEGVRAKRGAITWNGVGQVQVLVAGEYSVLFSCQFPAQGDSSQTSFGRTMGLWVNGAEPHRGSGMVDYVGKLTSVVPGGIVGPQNLSIACELHLNQNDLVQPFLVQSSGHNQTVNPTNFSVRRIA